ncbi:hypothetical protein GPECTOR_3g93 [Gonium pectorale]|uniref:Uncharacterized protein n=1 Tax=Gonium pectorale TaxID=33097 RepID=A0A150H090_GONPE|nr:hypothetical protein GPECTOR_3g93 [Gonium pectorale]|eukprot:KXZ55444.1 hypothetical protein GPECTOR_3g93 [Gonium pectorale]
MDASRLSEEEEDDWSSDSSNGQLVAALRQQLGDANSKVLALETQLAAVLREPLQVPAIRAVLQREIQREVQQAVQAALVRSTLAVDARLAVLQDTMSAVAVRAEELALLVTAADDRLQRLEDESGLQLSILPAAGPVHAAVRNSGSGNGSGKLDAPTAATLRSHQLGRSSSSGLGGGGALLSFTLRRAVSRRPSIMNIVSSGQQETAGRSQSQNGSAAGGSMAVGAAGAKRNAAGRHGSGQAQGILKSSGQTSDNYSRSASVLGLDQHDWGSVVSLLDSNQQRPSFHGLLHRPSRAGLAAKREGDGGSLRTKPLHSMSQALPDVASSSITAGHEAEDTVPDIAMARYRRAVTSSALAL